jgi:hypothetical protein
MAVRKHKATPAKRRVVLQMAAYGIPHKHIAEAIDCAPSAIGRHYPDELRKAKPLADTKVAHSLFLNATKHNNVTAQTFWLKTRAGWKEPKQEMQHSGAVGNYDLSKVSTEDLRKLDRILEAASLGSGDGQGGT